jgi:cell division septation protein DedD
MSAQDTRSAASSGNDPLAELARLIGQGDPFGEYGGRQNAQAPAPPQPARVSPQWAEHVAADAGYIPSPSAQPPQHPNYAAPPDLHPAEYAPPTYQPSVPGYEGGEAGDAGYEHESYYPNTPAQDAEHQDYYDDVPPRRRMGILAVAAVFALAVIGTAGAFGYRAIFGSSPPSGPPPVIKADTSPTKIVPEKKDAKNGKLIYDRVADRSQGEKLVSREEQPVDISNKSAGVLPHDQTAMNSGSIQPGLGSGVVGGAPRKIHTIPIRPDGTAMADAAPNAAAMVPQPSSPPMAAPAPPPPATPEPAKPMAPPPHADAAKPEPAPVQHHVAAVHTEPVVRHHEATPRNAPLSLNPNAPAPARRVERPMRTATATPRQIEPTRTARAAPVQSAPARTGGYAVQVASRHNEADAQASLHSLQAKYPRQLGGHRTMVRRVDLGAKGVYYRAMIGPFANAEEASHMCSQLKAAGGNCFVQRI